MIWVGGGIVLHGVEDLGWHAPADAAHDVAIAAGNAVPAISALVEWLVSAAMSGAVGLLIGALLIPIVQFLLVPLARRVRRFF